MDDDSTTSLGSLLQHMTFNVRNFFLISNLISNHVQKNSPTCVVQRRYKIHVSPVRLQEQVIYKG